MSNPTYTSRQVDFITHFMGSDTELTTAFNHTFGTCLSRSALRKKRQRMGIPKTAEQFRRAWLSLIGEDNEGIERDLRDNPPVDIYAEQRELAAARRMSGPVDIAGQKPSELLSDAPMDIAGQKPSEF